MILAKMILVTAGFAVVGLSSPPTAAAPQARQPLSIVGWSDHLSEKPATAGMEKKSGTYPTFGVNTAP